MNVPRGNLIEQAVNAVIRPPRRTYDLDSLPLYVEGDDGHHYTRHPVAFTNKRRQKLVGSVYLDSSQQIMNGGPCIIYLHGNASSQKEGQFLIPNFCSKGVAVYCFDFAGCGNSGGDYISLGYYETQDLNFLIEMLNFSFNMGPFVLWGRSMGAATAIMCRNPLVVCKIVDSAYTSIPDVCRAIATSVKLPAIFCPMALWVLKLQISDKANFDISTVSALDVAKMPDNVPILMCHAIDDEFVPFEEGMQLLNAYSNPDKKLYKTTKGHNGKRSKKWLKQAFEFAFKHLNIKVENDLEVEEFSSLHESVDHFRSYDDLVRFAKSIPENSEMKDSPIILSEIARPKYEISRLFNVTPIPA
ncbi:hypothetical protein TRFO_19878 [Tritrichomonas foetus]|uniref:Clan SC, family S9, unassigned serine peptidase n=1 Tax=Tritrichomonas foetus TaxID=1144522 RepID=A0A1J4KHB3_9EUKA|nr:hypothetical protein TRFO_19878 [Tritrichomonas foetus]|eukprot:OHT10745.1 hypothetical protein TRFO_19878 [Tritrichomonas foetus]